MELSSFYEMSLLTQVALSSGFLAYAISYAGFRETHTAVDTVFITLAFSAVASLFFSSSIYMGEWIASIIAFIATIFAACLWRGWLKRFFGWLLSSVHREDGVHRGWASVVQANKKVGQFAVYTKDGRVLHLLDRRKYSDAPWEGLYLGGDGSVVMIVEEEDIEDGSTVKRDTITDRQWGSRMSYIPADEIKRVEIRMK